MKTNFKIEDNYAVHYEGRLIDLHNNFEFEGMTDDVKNKEVALRFVKSSDNWVGAGEYQELTFLLKNVSYKHLEEGEKWEYPDDAKCLGEISFFPSELRNINDSIIPQGEPKEKDDLLFFFEDGRLIRVHCGEVELVVE